VPIGDDVNVTSCAQTTASYGSQYGSSSASSKQYATAAAAAKAAIGGWDKCLGPFDSAFAKEQGIDVWECHSNCFVRRDPNGGIESTETP